jgi:MoxR-like ATPase
VKVLIDYPDPQQEADIVRSVTAEAGGRGLSPDHLQPICTPTDILAAQRETATVQAVESVVQYAVALTRATRSHGAISLGAGTRGAISLVRVAKAYALLDGRPFITPSDVKAAALPVLRHRVTLAPEIAIGGQSIDDVLLSVIHQVQAPRT